MNDIEVGEYIRTRNGYIAKCVDVIKNTSHFSNYYIFNNRIEKSDNNTMNENELCRITKHSKNILDVLEVGDYVNGSRIIEVDSLTGYMKDIYLEEAPDYEVCCKEIKSILTHEQYESNSFSLEE